MDNAATDTPATLPDGSHQVMSPALVVALANAERISDWITKHHPRKIMETRNYRLAAPHFGICLEHRVAALLLISQNMRASALALWRPTYENYMRGHWALNVAGVKDFQQIAKTKAVPKFDTVIKGLDSKSKSNMFAKTKTKLWNPMSDFAHGGLSLLARCLQKAARRVQMFADASRSALPSISLVLVGRRMRPAITSRTSTQTERVIGSSGSEARA